MAVAAEAPCHFPHDRIADPFLVACATIASFFPYIGTAVYTIVRPPEFLEDAHERELEIKAAELRVRQLREQSCPNCEYPVEKNYLRCPNCQCQGTLVLNYGPEATEDDVNVLQRLEAVDKRRENPTE